MGKRIAIGMVGCGFFAQNHLNSWTDLRPDGADLVAVCDTDPAQAKAAAEKFSVPHWYTDAAAMFAAEQLDLVDIATQMRGPPAPREAGRSARRRHHRAEAVWSDHRRSREHGRRRADPAASSSRCTRTSASSAPLLKIADAIRAGAIGTPSWARISFRTGYDVYAGQPYLAQEQRFVTARSGRARARRGACPARRSRARHLPSCSAATRRRRRGHRDYAAAPHVGCGLGGRMHLLVAPPSRQLPRNADRDRRRQRRHRLAHREAASRSPARARCRCPTKTRSSTPWAERPWHVAQDSVLTTCRHMLEAVQSGRPADTSAEDNFKTFALVEAAYDAAGKVRPVTA